MKAALYHRLLRLYLRGVLFLHWLDLHVNRHSGGWVVLVDELNGDRDHWHAMGGGRHFNIDLRTGRFQDRWDAQQFAAQRNSEEPQDNPGRFFYVAHESRSYRPLPSTY